MSSDNWHRPWLWLSKMVMTLDCECCVTGTSQWWPISPEPSWRRLNPWSRQGSSAGAPIKAIVFTSAASSMAALLMGAQNRWKGVRLQLSPLAHQRLQQGMHWRQTTYLLTYNLHATNNSGFTIKYVHVEKLEKSSSIILIVPHFDIYIMGDLSFYEDWCSWCLLSRVEWQQSADNDGGKQMASFWIKHTIKSNKIQHATYWKERSVICRVLPLITSLLLSFIWKWDW